MTISYSELVERRRKLELPSYRSLADVGFDGPWITPYQITSRSVDGPALVALHWLDEPSINEHRGTLRKYGYLPGLRFNQVLDIALGNRKLKRTDLYVTQAFHLIPQSRSERIPAAAMDISFSEITRHELLGRKVIALGGDAERTCARHGIQHIATCHPSRRGSSNEANAAEITAALVELGF
ncbi:MAG: hypothetical protein AB7S92_15610 [Parvibaculaceae bacterium]